MCPPLIELSSISENLKIENCKCKRWPNIYCTFKGEGRSLKRIALGIMLMLLAVFLSTTIVRVDSATGASIVISPDTTTSPGSTFVLNLTINNVIDMRAWEVTLVYQKIITLTWVDTINDTTFTDGAGLAIFKTEDYNSSWSWADIARTTLSTVPGSGTGSGLVAQLHFTAVSTGTTAIDCISSEILDSNGHDITPITVTTPTITVATPQPPPKPSTVGGWSFTVAKAGSPDARLASIAIIVTTAAAITTAIYFKGIKRRKEKQ
jgi:hypothetical protein